MFSEDELLAVFNELLLEIQEEIGSDEAVLSAIANDADAAEWGKYLKALEGNEQAIADALSAALGPAQRNRRIVSSSFIIQKLSYLHSLICACFRPQSLSYCSVRL